MSNAQFVLLVSCLCGAMLAWGFRRLPQARWQFLACLPMIEESPGQWRGLNMTWYGLLSANAQAMAAGWFFLLLMSLGVPWPAVAAVLAVLSASCLVGSRWLAQVVEGKAHTFTVGGAAFLGLVLAPGLFWLGNRGLEIFGLRPIPLLSWCAALVSAYALGEGLGRLACISFGCCYGKPLDQCPAWMARVFANICFVFSGEHKKIAYASGLAGRKVLPVQAVTAVIFVTAAMISGYLFLEGRPAASLLVGGLATQPWRLLSEFLRADFRGGGRLSAYQWMALAATLWLAGLAWLLPAPGQVTGGLTRGLAAMWAPEPLIILQALWFCAFVYYGRSRVTTSRLSFSVLRHLT